MLAHALAPSGSFPRGKLAMSTTPRQQLRAVVFAAVSSERGEAMSEKLKPCPFCGGKAWAYSGTTYHFESGWGWICACKSCDAQGQIGETKAAAIGNWNRRTVQHCRYESTDHCTEKYSVCGREVETFHPGYRHCPRCGSYIEPEERMRGFRGDGDMKEAGL